MRDLDHDTFRRWLDLEMDDGLGATERGQLERHLASCSDCARERRELAALADTLAAGRVEVRADFRDQVMAGLPAAGWESSHPRTWAAAVAVFALLASLAAWLVTGAGQGAGAFGPVVATVLAVADLLGSSALAGAGLMAASWRGIGLALGTALEGSVLNLIALAIGVGGLNYLFFRMLRRGTRRFQAAAARRRSG